MTEPDRWVPRLALTRAEAAQALGMSLTSFDKYVAADVKMVRKGTLRVIPVAELENWVRENARGVFENVGLALLTGYRAPSAVGSGAPTNRPGQRLASPPGPAPDTGGRDAPEA